MTPMLQCSTVMDEGFMFSLIALYLKYRAAQAADRLEPQAAVSRTAPAANDAATNRAVANAA